MHLAVGAVLVAARVHTKPAELGKGKAEAQNREDADSKNEHKSLEQSGHTHHRGSPRGSGRSHYRRNDSADGLRRRDAKVRVGRPWIGPKQSWEMSCALELVAEDGIEPSTLGL